MRPIVERIVLMCLSSPKKVFRSEDGELRIVVHQILERVQRGVQMVIAGILTTENEARL